MKFKVKKDREIQTGFFTIEVLNEIDKAQTLAQGKVIAAKSVDKFIEEHPKVKSYNVKKAREVINRSNSLKTLLISVSNFMLAHPSEGLKIVE